MQLCPIEQYVINFLKQNGGSAKYNEVPSPRPSEVKGGIFSEDTVQRTIDDLEEAGLVEVVAGELPSGRKNRYFGIVNLKGDK